MNDQELSKQMCTYADAITAFAFVQGTAFGFVIGQNQTLADNVHHYWFFAAPIIALMNSFFFVAVYLCHRAEDRLIGIPPTRSQEAGAVVLRVRKVQLGIIAAIGVLEVALALGQAFWPEPWLWP